MCAISVRRVSKLILTFITMTKDYTKLFLYSTNMCANYFPMLRSWQNWHKETVHKKWKNLINIHLGKFWATLYGILYIDNLGGDQLKTAHCMNTQKGTTNCMCHFFNVFYQKKILLPIWSDFVSLECNIKRGPRLFYPLGKKIYYAILPRFWPFWCPVVILVTFSSNLRDDDN